MKLISQRLFVLQVNDGFYFVGGVCRPEMKKYATYTVDVKLNVEATLKNATANVQHESALTPIVNT